MSKDLNQCNFIGRLGQPVEQRFMPNGNAVSSFSIAVGDDYKDKNTGQKVEQTEWVNITCFGRLAEIAAQYLDKGSKVFISGKFKTESWEKDGVKRYATKIIANDLQMLDSRQEGQQGGQSQQGNGNGQGSAGNASRAPQSGQSEPQQQGPDNWDDPDIPF